MRKKLAGIIIITIFLTGCGVSGGTGMDPDQYNDWRKRVDRCIVENGVGPGVKDYCEALVRTQSTPTPTTKK